MKKEPNTKKTCYLFDISVVSVAFSSYKLTSSLSSEREELMQNDLHHTRLRGSVLVRLAAAHVGFSYLLGELLKGIDSLLLFFTLVI